MAGVRVFICLMLVILKQSLSFNVPSKSIFEGATLQLKAMTQTTQEKVQKKQEVMEENIVDVNETVNGMLVRIEELERKLETSDLNSVTAVKRELGDVVTNQNHLTSELSALYKSVTKTEGTLKQVDQLKEQVGSLAVANDKMALQLSSFFKAIGDEDRTTKEDTEGRVAFQVRQEEDPLYVPHLGVLKFDTVTLNKGNAYNPETGKFTAPSAGIYQFWAQITNVGSSVFVIQLWRNGKEIDRGYTSDGARYATLTINYVTELEKGDEVWFVNEQRSTTKIHGKNYSSYGGLKYM